MKTPTTEFSIAMQEKIQINRDFLLTQGWVLTEEKPLFERFVHSSNLNFVCSIGLYGEFSIAELHWCNKTPEKYFCALNPTLTEEDYFKIIDMLRLNFPKK